MDASIDSPCGECRRGAPRFGDQTGQSLLEVALTLPLLLLVAVGIFEFGRAYQTWQVVTNAAREGARVGVLDGATTSNVTTAVSNYLTSAKISGATTSVTPSPPSSAGYGQPVTVTVSVPFNSVSWLPSPLFLGGKTLSATSVMRRETVQ